MQLGRRAGGQQTADGLYIYRSSLSSRPGGEEACDRLEAAYPLELIGSEFMMAAPSNPARQYAAPEVQVALFRPVARSSGSPR